MTAKYSLAACLVWLLAVTFASAESPVQPGDRIAIIGNTFADQLRTHGYLETLLLQHTRDNPVSIRNLGWGGDMLAARDRPTGFPSEQSTLTAHKTDVIILVLGLEDGSRTASGEVAFEQYGAGDTTEPAYLTFAAYPDEHPVVSGGVPVAGWKQLESAPADLPAKAAGNVWVAELDEPGEWVVNTETRKIYMWPSDPAPDGSPRGIHPTDTHWMDEHLFKMRAAGQEKASRFGDPLFVDPAGDDFSFRPGSPALALGIEPLDVSKMGRLDDRSLLISDGSRFVPKDFYPEFSWETTPRYFMFGDKNRVLRPEQVRFIAERTGFLCIEKSHGMGELGAAELGAKHEAAAFKNIKPSMKVLFYFNAAYAWPYTTYNQNFTRQRIEAHPELKKFLITNPRTGELAQRYGAFRYDVLNPDFRDWWVETVAKGVRDSGCDGAFIDQMHGSVALRRNRRSEIEKAMGEMMSALKQRMAPDKILLANNAYSDDAQYVYPVSDAIMFENYATVKSSKESLLFEWGQMLRNAKAGKISVFRLGVEGTGRRNLKPNMPKLSQDKVEFALACYLIGAEPYSYFMYSWGWKLGTGALVDYPELKRPLGPPKGAYQRTTPDGWEFTREFEHASVWVNTETREAKITWR